MAEPTDTVAVDSTLGAELIIGGIRGKGGESTSDSAKKNREKVNRKNGLGAFGQTD